MVLLLQRELSMCLSVAAVLMPGVAMCEAYALIGKQPNLAEMSAFHPLLTWETLMVGPAAGVWSLTGSRRSLAIFPPVDAEETEQEHQAANQHRCDDDYRNLLSVHSSPLKRGWVTRRGA